MEGNRTSGVVGTCPITTATSNGKEVQAVVVTGSEVSTVTEAWVTQHLGDVSLQSSHITLRAVNGAEVPYSGILVVELKVFGNLLQDIPVLVVPEPNDPSMRERKKKLPLLLGMNVLGECKNIPGSFSLAIQELRLGTSSTVKGIAKSAIQTVVPSFSMATVRVTSTQRPSLQLLAAPLAHPLPAGLLLVPSLVSNDASRYVRVTNLSQADIILPARTPLATLQVMDDMQGKDEVTFTAMVNELVVTVGSPPESPTANVIPCPSFESSCNRC